MYISNNYINIAYIATNVNRVILVEYLADFEYLISSFHQLSGTLSEEIDKKDWQIEVEKVIRDEFGTAIWIRLKYFKFEKEGNEIQKKLYHDLVFMPNSNGWVTVLHRLNKDFVPPKRYHRMAVWAKAVLSR